MRIVPFLRAKFERKVITQLNLKSRIVFPQHTIIKMKQFSQVELKCDVFWCMPWIELKVLVNSNPKNNCVVPETKNINVVKSIGRSREI